MFQSDTNKQLDIIISLLGGTPSGGGVSSGLKAKAINQELDPGANNIAHNLNANVVYVVAVDSNNQNVSIDYYVVDSDNITVYNNAPEAITVQLTLIYNTER